MGNSSPDGGTVKGLHLVVENIAAARDQLMNHGAAVSDI
jgi:hypothetical protein